MNKWLMNLRKDGIRKRFLKWLIPVLIKNHHLAKDPVGSGRRKKASSNENPKEVPNERA